VFQSDFLNIITTGIGIVIGLLWNTRNLISCAALLSLPVAYIVAAALYAVAAGCGHAADFNEPSAISSTSSANMRNATRKREGISAAKFTHSTADIAARLEHILIRKQSCAKIAH
jgi:hypothetical protein